MSRDINELSVAEKRGLEPLVRSRYDTLIAQLRDTESRDITDMVKKIAKKFKIGAALMKIRQHKAAIALIVKGIEDLGFQMASGDESITDLHKEYDRNIGDYQVDYKKPAGKIYYNLTKARPDIKSVEKQRDDAVASLWLCTQKKDAREIVDSKINIPQLELKQ